MLKKASKPYSTLTMVWRYFLYRIKAGNKHSVQPPILFSFAENVLSGASKSTYKAAEKERQRLKNSKQVLDFVDYGKSGVLLEKAVADIAKKSLKPPKYAKLLSTIVEHQEAKSVLELGTSLGITTAYLARNEKTEVITLEGDPSVAQIAQSVWNQLGHKNIKCTVGPFEKTIESVLDTQYDVMYIDGNHRLEPTLRYFDQLQAAAHSKTLFIFDDIHYSVEMEQAWEAIKADERVSSTIDLFFVGVVYIDAALNKQHFTLSY